MDDYHKAFALIYLGGILTFTYAGSPLFCLALNLLFFVYTLVNLPAEVDT